MKTKNSKSFKVALGGVVTALSVALMLLTGIIPTLTYAMPALCGFLLTVLCIEIGKKFSIAVYIAISIISMLFVADKEAAVMYVMFFGYYPIVKGIIEKKCNKTVEWILKMLLFNITIIVASVIAVKVFMIPIDETGTFGKFAIPLLLILGNIVFIIYDIAMTRIITVYIYRWRKYIKRLFK